MPVQTTKKANIFFPDGAMVQVKTSSDEDWFDVGAINSSVTATLNWTESSVETANAGKLNTRVSNMEIAGGFTLVNLDPEGVTKLGGGVFTYEKRTSSEGVAAAGILYCGSSTVIMQPYAMRIEHTDDAGKKRTLDLFAVYSGSGGFQFNFKGANEDGIEEMPITFTARLDTSLTSGRQLMAWTIEEGAA